MAQKTIWRDGINMLRIVEDVENDKPILWLADDLDEVELSFTADDLAQMLPVMQSWLEKQRQ